jgi:isoquinoline 1-oxidoreductase subunit beta
MTDRRGIGRREFVAASVVAAGSLVLGFHFSPRPGRGTGRDDSDDTSRPFAPNAWLEIDRHGQVTVLVEKPELGQGARTYTAMMIAEELAVDLAAIRVQQAPTMPAIYTELHTAGSGGVVSTFEPMRRAGAQAREMLIAAAAQRWNVPTKECRAEGGMVIHDASKRRASYGDLAGAASRLAPIDRNAVPLVPPKDFRVIGGTAARVDVPSKVDGSARFGIDVRVPNMLFAVIARCPHFGGTLRSFDAAAARAVRGVRAVFAIPPLPRRFNTAGGVAVVADSTWQAMQGRKALTLQWAAGSASNESTDSLRRQMMELVTAPRGFALVHRGDAPAAFARGGKTIEATYESPFQAHATMEPMNTTVHVRASEIEVWSPTQFADEVQKEIADLSGRALDRVIVHMTLSGGSFGRRYQWDYAAEAWQVAKEIGQPVQLVWTREDDMQHDFYRPYNLQRLSARVDGSGRLVAWTTRIVTTPIVLTNVYTGMTDSPAALKDPATVAKLEWFGGDIAPYDVPNFRLDYVPARSAVPRSWWRSVSTSYTLFAKECFIDELAHALQGDPLDLRLRLLNTGSPNAGRVRRVLTLAAERARWGDPLPKGRGRGIACWSGETCSAQVAEVTVKEDGTVVVDRVVSVVDCGIAVSPDGVRAMTEGAINFGLTATLTAEITVKGGAVEQSNFHEYRVLRINQSPEVDVHIVPSERAPSGVGELGVMLIGPAVANAVFAATGVRVRRLPIDHRALATVGVRSSSG